MKQGLFITGTDTGIGKTLVSSLLVSSLHFHGWKCGYFKPIQTGTDLDSPRVQELSGLPSENIPSPTYSFPEPAAPYSAAKKEGQEIQIDVVANDWQKLDPRAWVVEGAGGLLVPVNSKQLIRDLVQALNMKVLIVAAARLGTINHTLLTVEAARAKGLKVSGIVINGEENPELESIFEQFTGLPVLARIPTLSEVSYLSVQQIAPNCFPNSTLRYLYDSA